MPSTDKPNEYLLAALELLQDFYEPAETMADADEMMSTDEVIECIKGIRPETFFTHQELHDELRKKNFRYDMVSPGCIRWLLRNK